MSDAKRRGAERGRVNRALVALAAAMAASGCCHAAPTETPQETYGGFYASSYSAPAAPRLGLSDEQIARALERQRVRAAERHERALDIASRAGGGDTALVASAVSACYALGERDAGDALADGAHGVYTWDRASKVALVACRYVQQGMGGALELTVKRREGVPGVLAVAFPPGTYGVADVAEKPDGERWTSPDDDRRYGRWPSQQDLAFLRAPVLRLEADEDEQSVLVPIACASFHSGPPAVDQTYALRRFEPGSPADRLMVALCAREKTSEPEAQLAVWLARNDISFDEYVEKGGDRGGILTFGTASRVLPRHGKGAARLLIEAGVNPGWSPFFQDHREGPSEAANASPEPPPAAPAPDEKPSRATP